MRRPCQTEELGSKPPEVNEHHEWTVNKTQSSEWLFIWRRTFCPLGSRKFRAICSTLTDLSNVWADHNVVIAWFCRIPDCVRWQHFCLSKFSLYYIRTCVYGKDCVCGKNSNSAFLCNFASLDMLPHPRLHSGILGHLRHTATSSPTCTAHSLCVINKQFKWKPLVVGSIVSKVRFIVTWNEWFKMQEYCFNTKLAMVPELVLFRQE